MAEIISDDAVLEATPGWKIIDGRLERSYRGADFGTAGEFVATVARIADEQNHHPDIELTYPGTARIMLTTHADGGLTHLDVALALAVDAVAADRGLTGP